MRIEDLPPENYLSELNNRVILLDKVIKAKTEELKNAPGGRIRCVSKSKHIEFYLITRKGDREGKYLPRSKDSLAQKIIQRDYDKKILYLLKLEKALLNKLIIFQHKNPIMNGFIKLSKNRQSCVKPVTLPDSEFALEWKDEKHTSSEFYDGGLIYDTITGAKVRSKSEVIIANTLEHYGIPFKYEKLLSLKNENGSYVDVHPDFICLNLRTRKEIIWEHFGMMGDSDYCEKTIRKIKLYEENKYFLGRNFIFTMESNFSPLTTREVELKIKEYLL